MVQRSLKRQLRGLRHQLLYLLNINGDLLSVRRWFAVEYLSVSHNANFKTPSFEQALITLKHMVPKFL